MKRSPRIEKLMEELRFDESTEIVRKHNGALKQMQTREIVNTREDDKDLNFDNRNLHRLQTLNSKLMSELADAKLSEESYLQKSKNEKNMQKMLEEKCEHLDKKLADNAEKLEAMSEELGYNMKMIEKIDTMKITVMFQQGALEMKLDDAKHVLESKYEEVDVLRGHLEAFLRKNCYNYAQETVIDAMDLLEEVAKAKMLCEGDLIPSYRI